MIGDLLNKTKNIGVVGLGYVGLPLAVLFSKKFNVIGFDINHEKISNYKKGIDVTCELPKNTLENSTIKFTSEEKDLKGASFIIISVPTPITDNERPDFKFIISASKTVGRNIQKGTVIVYESTVYPGITEDLCIPILEEESGLKCGKDFKVGYSPERINPGDKQNKLENITKIVSGMDEESLELISEVYGHVLNNGVYKAESIKVAEAAKVIENITRDVNIALVNEFAMIFDKMDINTLDVIEAAGTKWNFQKYYPGLVGGHCISVDPYYLLYKSKKLNFNPELMEISRKINESVPEFIVKNIVKILVNNNVLINGSKILIFGITFKENCNDIRNSKIVNVINELERYGVNLSVYDPFADADQVKSAYDIDLIENYDGKYDAIIFAVAHDEFKESSIDEINNLSKGKPIIFDIKAILPKEIQKNNNVVYWSL